MTEIHYYECDYCGEMFDDEGDCRAHEIKEKMGALADGFTLYDGLYQPISFTDLASGENNFDDVEYVVIQNKEAGDALNNYIENELGYSFYVETGTPVSYPCVLGFWRGECWQNLTEMYSEIGTILNYVS